MLDLLEDGSPVAHVDALVARDEAAVAARENAGDALALFSLDRIREFHELRVKCPSGISGLVQNVHGQDILLSYQLPGGQSCFEQALRPGS